MHAHDQCFLFHFSTNRLKNRKGSYFPWIPAFLEKQPPSKHGAIALENIQPLSKNKAEHQRRKDKAGIEGSLLFGFSSGGKCKLRSGWRFLLPYFSTRGDAQRPPTGLLPPGQNKLVPLQSSLLLSWAPRWKCGIFWYHLPPWSLL
jgi:hypothetical protein